MHRDYPAKGTITKNYQDKCDSLYTVISRNRWPSGTLPRHLSNGVNQTICRWDILSRDWNVIPQHTGILRLSASPVLQSYQSYQSYKSYWSYQSHQSCLSNSTSSKPCFTRKGEMDVTFRVTPWLQHITLIPSDMRELEQNKVLIGAFQITKLMDSFHKVAGVA